MSYVIFFMLVGLVMVGLLVNSVCVYLARRSEIYLAYVSELDSIRDNIQSLDIPHVRVIHNAKSLQAWRKVQPDNLIVERIREDDLLLQDINSNMADWIKTLNDGRIQLDAVNEGFIEDKREYRLYERKVISKLLYKQTENIRPQLEVSLFDVSWKYTSPKGRNRYGDETRYLLGDVMRVVSIIDKQAEYKKSVAYQRSLMTAGVRYDVFNRDGFRCQICGATQHDGVKLHVDHIKPVSKGGLTEMVNLQTLCETCNLGKSNKY